MNLPNYLVIKRTIFYGAEDMWWSTVAAALNSMSFGPRHLTSTAQCFKSSSYLPFMYCKGSIFTLSKYYFS
jgi:hypothetical protein